MRLAYEVKNCIECPLNLYKHDRIWNTNIHYCGHKDAPKKLVTFFLDMQKWRKGAVPGWCPIRETKEACE